MFYAVLGVIAVGGIIALAYALTGGGGGTAATEPVELNITDARALYEQATPIRLGEDTAPVKIVEFADYQCPGCAAFATNQKPRLQPYIDQGLAQFVFYDFPLGGSHVHSFLAARAARCAGAQSDPGNQGRDLYWDYHDRLFQQQSQWSAQRDVTDQFVTYAEEVGLDVGQFEQCLRSDRFAEVVTANRMLGEQLGVRSTPTVLVNNRRVQGNYIQDLGDNLIEVLEQEQAARAGQGAGAGGS